MNVIQFHRVMLTQLATIQMDHSTVLVMMVILEMDLHVMVKYTSITQIKKMFLKSYILIPSFSYRYK